MESLVAEFGLRTITKNDMLYICHSDIKNKLHVKAIFDKKHIIYEELNSDENVDNTIIDAFVAELEVKNALVNSTSHPEHFNAHKILGVKRTFRKKDEITILANVYKHYRHKYNIVYQYQFLEFKLDANIMIEIGSNGGLVIEIDEHGHQRYDEQSNEERQIILESCGYHFIRIDPDDYDEKDFIEKIDKQIREYELIYSIDINPEALWLELQDKSIDRDFFNFIGKSIVCTKKYCVDFDDVVKYLEYSRKSHAKRLLLDKFSASIDYVILKEKELKHRNDIFTCPEKGRSPPNKEFIFLTKFAFYTFALLSQTRKGKQIRTWIVNIYTKYQEVLVFTRQKLIDIKQNSDSKNAEKLYRMRTEAKHNKSILVKNRQIQKLQTTNDLLMSDNNKNTKIIQEQKDELTNYRLMFNIDIEKERNRDIRLQQYEHIGTLMKTYNATKNDRLRKLIIETITMITSNTVLVQ